MYQAIDKQHKEQEVAFLGNPRHKVTLGWLKYNDELAELIGCKPSLGKQLHLSKSLPFLTNMTKQDKTAKILTNPHKLSQILTSSYQSSTVLTHPH